MVEPDVGAELIRRRWKQGTVFQTIACMTYLTRLPGLTLRSQGAIGMSQAAMYGDWTVQSAVLGDNDLLMVVTQTCDIERDVAREPYVEAMRAYWTRDRGRMREAKRNSTREFLFASRVTETGEQEGLIVDATFRVHFQKESLLTVVPIEGVGDTTGLAVRDFGKWLGERYRRFAVPTHLVKAVQKPIVDAIKKLRQSDPKWLVLAKVREIMYFVHNGEEPYQIELVLIREDSESLLQSDDPELASLAAWLGGVLEKEGKAELASWELFDLSQISARDYAEAMPLPLDQYSLEGA